MIPRLKPAFGFHEILAALTPGRKNAVEEFESALAHALCVPYVIAFPYGRSALYAVLKANKIEGREVIQPAYTCVVVSQAILESGNRPRFVDINTADYNMNLDRTEAAVGDGTGAILATHLYGNPLNMDCLAAIRARHPSVLVIQDAALAWGATAAQGRLLSQYADVALYSFSIGKHFSTLEGGAVATQDRQQYEKIRTFRDSVFKPASRLHALKQRLFLFGCVVGFNKGIYRGVMSLAEKGFLDYFAKNYSEKDSFLPQNFDRHLGILEARIGLGQLKKLDIVMKRRMEIVHAYFDRLEGIPGLRLPSKAEGSSYSHFVVGVENRQRLLGEARKNGIHLGKEVFDYSIPEIPFFAPYAQGTYPGAGRAAREAVMLPLYPGLSHRDCDKITGWIRKFYAK